MTGAEIAVDVLRSIAVLGGAFLLALPVGWDREQRVRSMGLRTFPLVAMGSAGWALVAESIARGDPGAEARVVQGLVTGIGFLGGGAILKTEDRVRGTATAAAIWATALIGAAVAFDRYETAIALSLCTFLTLRALKPFKRQVNGEKNEYEDDDYYCEDEP